MTINEDLHIDIPIYIIPDVTLPARTVYSAEYRRGKTRPSYYRDMKELNFDKIFIFQNYDERSFVWKSSLSNETYMLQFLLSVKSASILYILC